MRTRVNILASFILLMAGALSGCAGSGGFPPQVTGGLGVGISLDVETVTPITVDGRQVYAVKFVCGHIISVDIIDPAFPAGPLSPGVYRTTINIVNPNSGEDTATLDIRAIQTLTQDPNNVSGIVGTPVMETLTPYQGIEIDCSNIRELLGNLPVEFLEGFVLIKTAQPLSVVGVHTVKNVEGGTGVLESRCTGEKKAMAKEKKDYLDLVVKYKNGEATCEQIKKAFEELERAKDRCVLVCQLRSRCPSMPLGPGAFPGTEACR